MLKTFVRESAFFQSLRDRDMTITGIDLDQQFNNIAKFINKEIRPLIISLTDKKIPGIAEETGALLKNIGDGTTAFSRLSTQDIADYLLDLKILTPIDPKSMLMAGADGGFGKRAVASKEGQVFASINDHELSWQELKGEHFKNNSIHSSKVGLGVIDTSHLIAGIVGRPLDPQSVTSNHIIDSTIPAIKIANGAFSSQYISNSLMATRSTNLVYQERSIKEHHIADNSIDFARLYSNGLRLASSNIPQGSIKLASAGDIDTGPIYDSSGLLSSSFKLKSFTLRINGTAPNYNGQISAAKLSPALKAKLRQGGLRI